MAIGGQLAGTIMESSNDTNVLSRIVCEPLPLVTDFTMMPRIYGETKTEHYVWKIMGRNGREEPIGYWVQSSVKDDAVLDMLNDAYAQASEARRLCNRNSPDCDPTRAIQLFGWPK